jgi:hypothetical protein
MAAYNHRIDDEEYFRVVDIQTLDLPYRDRARQLLMRAAHEVPYCSQFSRCMAITGCAIPRCHPASKPSCTSTTEPVEVRSPQLSHASHAAPGAPSFAGSSLASRAGGCDDLAAVC